MSLENVPMKDVNVIVTYTLIAKLAQREAFVLMEAASANHETTAPTEIIFTVFSWNVPMVIQAGVTPQTIVTAHMYQILVQNKTFQNVFTYLALLERKNIARVGLVHVSQ